MKITAIFLKTLTSSCSYGAVSLILLLCAIAHPQEWCEFIITECPLTFNGDTIDVPEKVIAMGPRVHGCEADSSTPAEGTPSIMFLVDNSGSMSGVGGSTANDRMGSRYSVMLSMLDEIYARIPDAEVGVAVFQNILYFDHRDDSFFEQLPGNVDGVRHQSYIPLTRLNEIRTDGRKGIEKLKEVLTLDTSRAEILDSVQDYVHLEYIPSDMSNHSVYTNINVAFDAAKEAFKNAANPQQQQFIIFFSDGNPRGDMQAGKDPYYFQEGNSVPTTFTVFFTSENAAPQSLVTMTDNIKTNDYSATNPKSDLWTIETSHDALLELVLHNILDVILLGQPNSISVTGLSIFDSTTTYIDSYFILQKRIPLQPAITPFNLDMALRYSDQATQKTRDTIIDIDFHVRRVSDSVTLPQGIELHCWPRPTLQFAYDNVPISMVHDSMQQLQLRFSTGDSLVDSVSTALHSSIDSHSTILADSGNYWSGTFERATAQSATPGDP
ncbi:MAG: hypothetical protein GF401_18290, partial [Chitinivibrionales bacterium]|nr:hypothetical protein [Chitinivibrionales bacterium]